jgi:hypothetical protein
VLDSPVLEDSYPVAVESPEFHAEPAE